MYRGQIDDAVPAGIPPAAGDAARDTLGGAAGVADQLPPALLTAAAQAFTDGLLIAAAISAVALAAMAVLAAIVLRDVRAGAGADEPQSREPDESSATDVNAPRRPAAATGRS